MNARICSVVLAVTLLTTSTGCSGIRNFLFGRGARCGLCNQTETAPAYDTTCQPCVPMCNNVVAVPGCVSDVCGTCGPAYGAAYGCQCGDQGITVDPYMQGGTIIDSGVPGVVGNGIQDSWQPRKYDAQGDLIIQEGPMVPANQ